MFFNLRHQIRMMGRAQNIQDNQEDLLHNLDNAIILNKLVEVKAIIDQHPSILNQTYSDGKTPIFNAISSDNPDIVSAIIGKDPLVLNQTLSDEKTPIFYAILLGKLDAVKTIIEKDPSVLNQTLPDGNTPIFEAISSGNPDIVSAIIEKDPSVLTQTIHNGMLLITDATQKYLTSSGSQDEKTKRSEILRIILKKQFGENITQNDQSDLEELLFNKSLLNGLHSKLDSLNGFNYLKNAFEKNNPENIFDSIYKDLFKRLEGLPFGKSLLNTLHSKLDSLNGFNFLKNAFDKINPKNTFDNVYKDLFKSVDKNIPVELGDGSKMYIFSSNLKKHVSFFIFHTDAKNKLKSISYCDGNYAEIESQKIKNSSSTHIMGITTFHLKDAIDYSESFAKDFIDQNSKGKSIFDLYDKFKKSEISGVKIDFSKTTHSIPTKIQERGNCGFKSTSLLARFILEKKDSKMNFDYDEKTQKPIGAGYDEYKKFKTDLIKKSLDSVSKLKEKISKKSDSFSKYLKEEIEDIFKTKKIYTDSKQKKLNPTEATPSEKKFDTPGNFCFPFFFDCLERNKNNSPGR